MKKFFDYLKTPYAAITFTVVGAGGTGSQFLAALAKMAVAYAKLRDVTLNVLVIDHDTVSESNVGRQLFAHSEIGMNKAECIVTKINRTYGLSWEAVPESFEVCAPNKALGSNFIISCVDNVKTRKNIAKYIAREQKQVINENVMNHDVWCKNFFWVDIGNSKNSGQIIIGSPNTPNIMETYPDLKDSDDNTPSCSLAEALSKQDLFVNTFAANLAAKSIWMIITEYFLPHAGLYFNLETYKIKPIPLDGINKSAIRNSRSRGTKRRLRQETKEAS